MNPELKQPPDYELQRYRAWRAANRPFRRAFPGGEARRSVLLKAGLTMAANRARKEAQS